MKEEKTKEVLQDWFNYFEKSYNESFAEPNSKDWIMPVSRARNSRMAIELVAEDLGIKLVVKEWKT